MKKIFNILFMAASLMLYPACQYQMDDVFEESSAIRVQEEMKRIDKVLKAAGNGWIMEYYAATKYGGYNIICKFNEDNTVLAQSEILGDKTAVSHYKFEQSQGVVLSFDEYNEVIHYFSNPANPDGIGDDGDGMLGDFEFRVLSADEDLVVLKGKKHGSRVVMRRLEQGVEWSGYFAKVLEMEETMSAAAYVLTFGDESVIASASYRQLSFMDPATGVAVNVPYIFTDKGYRLYSDLTYKGKTAGEFIYSAADEKCYSPDDNTVSIEIKITPLSELMQSGYWFLSEEGMSQSTLAYFLKAKEGSANEGESIVYMFIGTGEIFGPDFNTGWGVVFQSGRYAGTLYLTPTAVDDNTITLQYSGADKSNGAYYVANCNYGEIGNVLSSTFDLTTDNPRNPSWIKLQDTGNTDNYLTLYARTINYPFGE